LSAIEEHIYADLAQRGARKDRQGLTAYAGGSAERPVRGRSGNGSLPPVVSTDVVGNPQNSTQMKVL